MTVSTALEEWCLERQTTAVECLVPDLAGNPRGKILPTSKFLEGLEDDSHRLPESIFVQTVTGDYPKDKVLDHLVDPMDVDVVLRPDLSTIRPVPWLTNPTAQVICNAVYADDQPVGLSSRQVLQSVLALFSEEGLKPIVAPELEFYLVAINSDPNNPLAPPKGRSGRAESGRQAFGIDAVKEFDELFGEIYKYCKEQGISVDNLNHEAGVAQFEINFQHGDALGIADQVFLFKRTVRQAATSHSLHATFMAKPMQAEPGNSIHLHQSLVDTESGHNVFAGDNNGVSDTFMNYIGGLQKYMPAVMALFAPTVNSYRRFTHEDAPINTHWGFENRTCGFRVPNAPPEGTRIENRLAGSDVNPYLIVAGSLICGYLGIKENVQPEAAHSDNALHLPHDLPQNLDSALAQLSQCGPIRNALGDTFCQAFIEVKQAELEIFKQVISPWEREHLLLNV